MKTILLAGAVAMLGPLVGTRWFVKFLAAHGYGQYIRDDGPTTHRTKKGTPTMGGAVIIVSVLLFEDMLIIREFDGGNYAALAIRYGISEVWVRQIVNQQRVRDNSVSLFDEPETQAG